jgi:hypothetical protein
LKVRRARGWKIVTIPPASEKVLLEMHTSSIQVPEKILLLVSLFTYRRKKMKNHRRVSGGSSDSL